MELKREKRRVRTYFFFARERVSTIFILCMAAVVLRMGSREVTDMGYIEFTDRPMAADGRVVKRDGFMVLGMHRSGTSMLTGLLVKAAGYTFGGQYVQSDDNQKGFFERLDVQIQNKKWMKRQKCNWQKNILAFDWEQALKDKESGAVDSKYLDRALEMHFNNQTRVPWLQKDPRMCITLKVWLKFLDREPAIVFTYRHPLEVALSLNKRNDMSVTKGLKLWIAYNMRAIQNSIGLCIVRTKNPALLADPLKELQRISDELTTKCGVPAPLHPVLQTQIDNFIDPNLQHQHVSANKENEVLETYNDGTCVAYSFESGRKKNFRDRKLYLTAMQVYCDLESGKAYEEDYVWPDVS